MHCMKVIVVTIKTPLTLNFGSKDTIKPYCQRKIRLSVDLKMGVKSTSLPLLSQLDSCQV